MLTAETCELKQTGADRKPESCDRQPSFILARSTESGIEYLSICDLCFLDQFDSELSPEGWEVEESL